MADLIACNGPMAFMSKNSHRECSKQQEKHALHGETCFIAGKAKFSAHLRKMINLTGRK